jgi:hypothetical protein
MAGRELFKNFNILVLAVKTYSHYRLSRQTTRKSIKFRNTWHIIHKHNPHEPNANLTPFTKVLEKLRVPQLGKKFASFYGT